MRKPKSKVRQIKLPPPPPPLSDHHIETLVEQIIYGGSEEKSCNALLVLMEEIQIAAGLSMNIDRTLHIALTAQVKAFSLEPIEMAARIDKIRSRLISSETRAKRKAYAKA